MNLDKRKCLKNYLSIELIKFKLCYNFEEEKKAPCSIQTITSPFINEEMHETITQLLKEHRDAKVSGIQCNYKESRTFLSVKLDIYELMMMLYNASPRA